MLTSSLKINPATTGETLQHKDAREAVQSLNPDTEALKANAAYLNGDHYQKGNAWGGPPVPDSIAGHDETLNVLKRDQAPVPVIEEVAEHYVTGVVGTEPAFEVELAREIEEDEEPNPQETADLALFNDALTAFYDGCGASEPIQQFVENLCSGRAVLRPIFAPAFVESGEWEEKDLLGTARSFSLEAPEWEAAGVLTDKRSMQKAGVYLYSQKETAADVAAKNRAEVTYLDEKKKTVFLVLEENGEQAMEPQTFDCNGNIWLFQATLRRPILGQAQRELQRKIDFLNYILPKNAQFAGFRERHFMGVDRPKDEAGGYVDPELGPGKVGFWQPAVVDTEDGPKALPATLILTEPVDSGPIRADIAHLVEVLLKSRHLLHTVISGDAVASAISRVQSRAQFTRALLKMKVKVETVLRDLFMTVLCLACEFSGEKELLARLKKDYRIRVDVRIDAGPITPEEELAIMTMFDKGLLDRETAQAMLGVEDIGAVNNRLQMEAEDNLDVQIKRAQLFNEYVRTFEAKVAAELAGLPESITEKILEVSGNTDSDPRTA